MHNFPRNADAYIAMLRDIQYHTDFVTASAELHSGPKLTQKVSKLTTYYQHSKAQLGALDGNRKETGSCF